MSGFSPVDRELTYFEHLLKKLGDDFDTTDMEAVDALLEGETDLLEMAQSSLDEIDFIEALQIGVETKAKALMERSAKYKAQIGTIKAVLEKITVKMPDQKLRLDSATCYMRKGSQSVVIVDQDKIPFDLMRTKDPEPDKTAIAELLKAEKAVDGCTLSNGAPSFQIKRK